MDPSKVSLDSRLLLLGRLGLGQCGLVLAQHIPPNMNGPLVTPTNHPQFSPHLPTMVNWIPRTRRLVPRQSKDQVDTPNDGLVYPSSEFPLDRSGRDVPDPEDGSSFGRGDEVFPIRRTGEGGEGVRVSVDDGGTKGRVRVGVGGGGGDGRVGVTIESCLGDTGGKLGELDMTRLTTGDSQQSRSIIGG
jgi:hypothetical protein